MKLLYVRRTPNGSEVVYDQSIVQYNYIPVTVINQMCVEEMSTYKGRRDAIKKKYGIKNLVPIMVSDDVLLFPIHSPRTYENIWINYHEIISYHDGDITFRGGRVLSVNNGVVNTQLKKCYEIAF